MEYWRAVKRQLFFNHYSNTPLLQKDQIDLLQQKQLGFAFLLFTKPVLFTIGLMLLECQCRIHGFAIS